MEGLELGVCDPLPKLPTFLSACASQATLDVDRLRQFFDQLILRRNAVTPSAELRELVRTILDIAPSLDNVLAGLVRQLVAEVASSFGLERLRDIDILTVLCSELSPALEGYSSLLDLVNHFCTSVSCGPANGPHAADLAQALRALKSVFTLG